MQKQLNARRWPGQRIAVVRGLEEPDQSTVERVERFRLDHPDLSFSDVARSLRIPVSLVKAALES
jgi:hypothetical protein